MPSLDQQIRDGAKQVFQELQGAQQFSSFGTSSHVHNGTDGQQINQKDIVVGDKFFAQIEIDSSLGSNIIILNNTVVNPSKLSFRGIAQYPATVADYQAGTNPTATIKGTIVGGAELGPCFSLIPSATNPSGTSLPKDDNILQDNVSIELDGTQLSTALTLTGSLSIGATSATLTAPSTWTGATGRQLVVFSSGESRAVLFTNGSTAITWVGGLTATATSAITVLGSFIPHVSFDPFNLASFRAPDGSLAASFTVTSWTSTSITFTAFAASGYLMVGGLIIT